MDIILYYLPPIAQSNLIKTNWELPYVVVSFPPSILRILKYLQQYR